MKAIECKRGTKHGKTRLLVMHKSLCIGIPVDAECFRISAKLDSLAGNCFVEKCGLSESDVV